MRHFVDYLNELDNKKRVIQKELERERERKRTNAKRIYWLNKRLSVLKNIRQFPIKHRN